MIQPVFYNMHITRERDGKLWLSLGTGPFAAIAAETWPQAWPGGEAVVDADTGEFWAWAAKPAADGYHSLRTRFTLEYHCSDHTPDTDGPNDNR